MKLNNSNNEPTSRQDKELSGFLTMAKIPYAKSKDDVWSELDVHLNSHKVAKTRTIGIRVLQFSTAASIVLLCGLISLMFFYSELLVSEKGQHLSVVLPDGSKVDLNAQSSIYFKPYWWRFKREVNFEGEAFFTAEKGKTFTIVSKNGTTEILGTSFNIYSRNSEYKVFCKTGKVKVENPQKSVELLINPGEIADLKSKQVQFISADEAIAWKDHKFAFTSASLLSVLEEFERQYNVSISLQIENPSKFLYTGYFKKTATVDLSLTIVCKSFNLTFQKKNENNYVIFAAE